MIALSVHTFSLRYTRQGIYNEKWFSMEKYQTFDLLAHFKQYKRSGPKHIVSVMLKNATSKLSIKQPLALHHSHRAVITKHHSYHFMNFNEMCQDNRKVHRQRTHTICLLLDQFWVGFSCSSLLGETYIHTYMYNYYYDHCAVSTTVI